MHNNLTCFPWLVQMIRLCAIVETKSSFVRSRLICEAELPSRKTEEPSTHTNKQMHTHHLVTTLFSSHLKWEHALGSAGRMEVKHGKRKGKKKDRKGNKMKEKNPKGRTQSDKRPNQERERGGEIDSEREHDRGCGSAWRVSGVKELWFIVMSQPLPPPTPRPRYPPSLPPSPSSSYLTWKLI